jgi:hypothetical protein
MRRTNGRQKRTSSRMIRPVAQVEQTPLSPEIVSQCMVQHVRVDTSSENHLGLPSPALSFSTLARHRAYSCDPGWPYALHRASSISVNVCASFRCCSIAWPAGESGGQLACATGSRHSVECPAHPARRSSKTKDAVRIDELCSNLKFKTIA